MYPTLVAIAALIAPGPTAILAQTTPPAAAAPTGPLVYGVPPSGAGVIPIKKKRRRKDGNSPQMPQMPQMPNMGGGKGGKGGEDSSKNASVAPAPTGGSDGGTADPNGSMQDCGALPAGVKKDLDVMLDFRKNCPAAQGAMNKNMALNEYKCGGVPTMYVFDAGGTCLKKMAVSYGTGKDRATADSGPATCPQACSENSRHFTPPGFHLTAVHPYSKKTGYGPTNSLALSGLEGQRSLAPRGILIHEAKSPGTASSWGCSGVTKAGLDFVMEKLGTGALVYNAFDATQLSAGCGETAGITHSAASCRSDGGGGAAPAGRGSSGSGSTSK